MNQDGIVNGLDIADFASHWLQVGGLTGDANGDNIVNGLDIAAIASHWLATLPPSGGANTAALTVATSNPSGTGAAEASSSDAGTAMVLGVVPPPTSGDQSSVLTSSLATSAASPPLPAATCSTGTVPTGLSADPSIIASAIRSPAAGSPLPSSFGTAGPADADQIRNVVDTLAVAGAAVPSVLASSITTTAASELLASSSAGVSTTASVGVLSSSLSQGPEAGPVFVPPQTFDRVAAFVGRASDAPSATVVDQLMLQQTGQDDALFVRGAIVGMASLSRHGSRGGAAADDDQLRSLDDDLLDALVQGIYLG